MERHKPHSEVVAVMLYNTYDDQGEWIPTRYERLSWVRMNPRFRGTWAQEAHRHRVKI